MSEKRAGIILLRKYADSVTEMSIEDAGYLLKAIYAYDAGDEVPKMPVFARATFLAMRADMDEHAERYAAVCERNRQNAQKRWNRQPEASMDDECGGMPSGMSAKSGISEMPREKKRKEKKKKEAKGGEEKTYISGRADEADVGGSTEMTHTVQPDKVYPLLTGPDKDRFEQFWAIYPRRESRARAEAAWQEISPDDELTAQIIAAVETACASDARFATQQYTPHPANWLLWREWENEYDVPKSEEEVDYGSWDLD